MTKRILELAESIDLTAWGQQHPDDDAWCVKFAELIARECLCIVYEVRGEPASDTHFVIGYDRACGKIIDAIKENFGVTE